MERRGYLLPRKGSVSKREVLPDPIYKSTTVSRFANKLMYDGNKGVARSILYDAMDIMKEKSGKDALETFDAAIRNASPVLEVKPRRVGGATYQVPVEVNSQRKLILAIRWLVNNARKRGEKTMAQRLAGELLDAANNTGVTIKKKEDTHKMAESNRAFAHYRW
jgi:small subunit ribosomal protein S7